MDAIAGPSSLRTPVLETPPAVVLVDGLRGKIANPAGGLASKPGGEPQKEHGQTQRHVPEPDATESS